MASFRQNTVAIYNDSGAARSQLCAGNFRRQLVDSRRVRESTVNEKSL
jgi:hypothetical protein